MNFDEDLLLAIKEGDNDFVKAILQISDLYRSVDDSSSTLLHYSVRHGNEIITQFLLDSGTSVNAKDSMGNTALMIALEENNEALVKILLSNGADVLLRNDEGKNVFHILATNHQIDTKICMQFFYKLRIDGFYSKEIAKILFEADCPTYIAAFTLDHQVLEYILEKKSPVNSAHPLQKFTGMHVAVWYSRKKCVRVLLKYGADAKALDDKNANPFYYLYKENENRDESEKLEEVEILKMLLDQGVSTTSYTSQGDFNVSHTLIEGHSEAIKVLLESNLDFEVRDELHGRNVLHHIAQNINSGVVQVLMCYELGGVNAIDKTGFSPLAFAAYTGNPCMVKFLLNCGAEPNTKQKLPLYFAYTEFKPNLQIEYDTCVELLLQCGSDLEFVLEDASDEIVTLFDLLRTTSNVFESIMKPAIGQLLLTKQLGLSVSERTRCKINSNPSLRDYYNDCRILLGEKIFGSITFIQLLNARYKKMAKYLNNENLEKETTFFLEKYDIKYSHPYLYNTWRRRFKDGKRYKILKDQAAEALSRILGNLIDKKHLIVENIINYLNIATLEKLARSEDPMWDPIPSPVWGATRDPTWNLVGFPIWGPIWLF